MRAEIFTEKLFEAAKAANLPEFQIAYSCGTSSRIDVFEGKIASRADNESQSLSMAVKIGQNIGHFSCEELEEKNIPLIIKQAKENAELIDINDENFFHDGQGVYTQVKKYEPLPQFSTLDTEKFLLDIEKNIYALDNRIKKVISLSLRNSDGKVIMKNSLGLNLKDDYKMAYVVIYLSAEENGIIKSADEIIVFDKAEDFNPLNCAKKAVEKVTAKLGAGNITSGKYKVVFENKTFASLLETVAGIFSANLMQEKRSKLVGKQGKKVASEIVTLVDNPFRDKGYGSRSFDSEGYPAQENVIIKDGILKTYLHNLRTARKDGVKSTGNGSGGRGVSFSNFYVEPGKPSKDEVLKEVVDGIYITDLNGMHAGYSSVSGDFSFGAEGFKIENGKIGQALNQFTVSGNIYRLWEEIVLLGSDLEFAPGGFGAPTVAIKELSISND